MNGYLFTISINRHTLPVELTSTVDRSAMYLKPASSKTHPNYTMSKSPAIISTGNLSLNAPLEGQRVAWSRELFPSLCGHGILQGDD
jgi:hypothetical protein